MYEIDPMNTQLAIVLFPAIAAGGVIEELRREFDPLANVLAAHITLVFPFPAPTVPSAVIEHLQTSAESAAAFECTLAGVSAEPNGFLFLDVDTGADACRAFHERLYSGLLAKHRSTTHTYRPHVTIGRLTDSNKLDDARRVVERAVIFPLRGSVHSVSLFRLTEPHRGDVVTSIPLIVPGV
jgi:2'-5' RNA ligase